MTSTTPRCLLSLTLLLSALSAVLAQAPARAKAPGSAKTITVSQGTDMAIAVSPDHRTIIMDVQGIL
jgi:hypothetical protein